MTQSANFRVALTSEFTRPIPGRTAKETLTMVDTSDTTLDTLATAAHNAAKNVDGNLALFNFAADNAAAKVTRGAGSFDPRVVEHVKFVFSKRAEWPLSKHGLRTIRLANFPEAPTDDPTRALTRADMTPVTNERWSETISPIVNHVMALLNLAKVDAVTPKSGQIRVIAAPSDTTSKYAGTYALQVYRHKGERHS